MSLPQAAFLRPGQRENRMMKASLKFHDRRGSGAVEALKPQGAQFAALWYILGIVGGMGGRRI
ncbi:MAG: hypothetical protein GVY36_19295 [Verrucomicrobia bacterium]|nr:hypothetical protein [Verrucomicrobiota bacterium]